MRRIWLALLVIVSLDSMVLSGCAISPTPETVEHRDGGGGGSY
jgi:hypothetical protein